jgi:hypothetical protein
MNFINYLLSTYLGAIVSLLFGLFYLLDTIKHQKKYESSALQPYTKGIVGGIGFMLIGIIIIIAKLMGKL